MKIVWSTIIFVHCMTLFSSDVYFDQPYHPEPSPLQQFVNNLPFVPEILFAASLLYHCFASEKPEPNWNDVKWNEYLHKKLNISNERDFMCKAVHFYRGYRHYGFCRLVANFECEETLFDDVRTFLNSNAYTPLRSYYNYELKEKYRTAFCRGLQSVVQWRDERIQRRIGEQQKAEQERVQKERERQEKIHCDQQRQHVEEQKRQELEYQHALTKRLQEQKENVVQVAHEYETSDNFACIPADIMAKRLRGLEEHKNGNYIVTKQQYALSSAVSSTLKAYKLSVQSYEICVGSQLQQILHKECVKVVENSAHADSTALNSAVIDFVELGRLHNQAGFIDGALKALDVCWSLLQCGAYAGKAVVEGIAQGTQQLATSVADFVFAPIETVHELVLNIRNAAEMLHRFLEPYAVFIEMPYSDEPINLALIVCAQQLTDYVRENPYEVIKETSSLLTNMWLTNRSFEVIGKLLSSSAQKIAIYAEKIKESAQILSADEIPALIAADAAGMIASEQIIKEATTVETVMQGATSGPQALLAQLNQLLEPMHKELPTLKKLFDCTRKGFGEFANKYIKLPYEHILSMELFVNKNGIIQLSGFHHDFMGLIEQSGLVSFTEKIIGKEGIYKTNLWLNGRQFPNKTFFPQHWTREQVMSKIVEAYDDFIAKGAKNFELRPDGKYIITGTISEGFEIEMYITKNGQITSAYPLL